MILYRLQTVAPPGGCASATDGISFPQGTQGNKVVYVTDTFGPCGSGALLDIPTCQLLWFEIEFAFDVLKPFLNLTHSISNTTNTAFSWQNTVHL